MIAEFHELSQISLRCWI